MSFYDKLKALNIELPSVSSPAAAYVMYVQTGNTVFISGHIAKKDGKPWVGQLGRDTDTATGKLAARAIAAAPASAWLGFSYVSVFSMVIGFFFWYRGMALGGVARVGQVQLIQPFLTLLGSALLLGEVLEADNFLFALVIIAVVAIGRKMPIGRQG